MNSCLLCIGSNAPNAAALMARAEHWLEATFSGVVTSGLYSTAALNGVSPDYTNMIARVDTELTATEVTALGKAFEDSCGRRRDDRSAPVAMDVDLMMFNNVTLRPAEFSRSYFTRGMELLKKKCKFAL